MGCPKAPDLAIEVVSPHDRTDDVRAKAAEYLAAGSQAVWVLWPETRSVSIPAAGEPVRDLPSPDVLDGGSLFPGFSVVVADLVDIRLKP